MTLEIRFARPEDAEDLCRLNRLFNGEGVAGPQQTREALSKALLSPDGSQEQTVIALADGQAVGFLCGRILRSWCYQSPSAELTELYVLDIHRRRGVGKALIAFLEDFYRREQVCECTLKTGLHNHKAQSLYQQMGYRRESELVYQKELGPE